MGEPRRYNENDSYRIAPFRLIRADDHWFLFQVATCAIFEIPSGLGRWLKRVPSEEIVVPAQAVQQGLWGDASDPELWQNLVNIGALIPADMEAPRRPKALKTDDAAVNTLILQVTDQCNLACDYCYRHGAAGKITRPAMSLETARRSIDFLIARSQSADRVTVVFFGGEPLLNRSLIGQTIDYARRRCQQSGQSVDFALTTNGTLFSRNCIEFIKTHQIGITVSIDGDEQAQNRHRRFADGSDTYASVAKGVRALLATGGIKPPVARVTLGRSTVSEAESILDHLLALGFIEVGLAPVTSDEPDMKLGAREMAQLLSSFRNLSNRFMDLADGGQLLGFSNLIDLLVNLHQGERKLLPCGAGLGLLAVDTQGRLFPCQRLTDEASLRMGDIFHGIDGRQHGAFYRKVNEHRKHPCRRCWVRHFCSGGCYHEALVRHGNPAAPNTHYCDWIKQWTRIGLEAYARLAVRCPDLLDQLALLRTPAPPAHQQARKEI